MGSLCSDSAVDSWTSTSTVSATESLRLWVEHGVLFSFSTTSGCRFVTVSRELEKQTYDYQQLKNKVSKLPKLDKQKILHVIFLWEIFRFNIMIDGVLIDVLKLTFM